LSPGGFGHLFLIATFTGNTAPDARGLTPSKAQSRVRLAIIGGDDMRTTNTARLVPPILTGYSIDPDQGYAALADNALQQDFSGSWKRPRRKTKLLPGHSGLIATFTANTPPCAGVLTSSKARSRVRLAIIGGDHMKTPSTSRLAPPIPSGLSIDPGQGHAPPAGKASHQDSSRSWKRQRRDTMRLTGQCGLIATPTANKPPLCRMLDSDQSRVGQSARYNRGAK
jgi:hypothetical protein